MKYKEYNIMLEKVREILLNHTQASAGEIELNTELVKDLGLNSLDVVSLIIDFEDKFGIEISDRTIRDFVTVGDIVEYLEIRM